MIKGTKEYLDKIAGDYYCPEHPKMALTVAWHPEQFYVIRCGGDHYPDEVTRQPSLTELHKQGVELPEPIKSNVQKGMARRQSKGLARAGDILEEIIPHTDLGTGQLLGPDMVQFIKDYAWKYGLDPYRSHVMIMHSKPYIGLDGYLYDINRKNIPYSLTSHPLDDNERKAYQVPDGSHAWQAVFTRHDTEAQFFGLGIVTQDEMTARSKKDSTKLAAPVVAAHPWQLAQKRAEWQALRRGDPIGDTDEAQKGGE